MEEVIERVSAIFDSPVLGYSWHKTHRQKLLISLVFFFFFGNNSFLLAEKASELRFAPYQSSSDRKDAVLPKTYEIWNRNVRFSSMESVDRAVSVMEDVDKYLGNLQFSIKELVEANPITDEDHDRVLKALAELDGILTYVQQKLRYGKDQLSAVIPENSDDVAKCNSLNIRFISNLHIAYNLKKIIAEKLSSASKRGKNE